ncbi:enoyl-CoA hydratase/isomerase family protein [Paraburkholderia tropica]|uniref:3-hydroxyisobutyryl-CoA hydrolase n=1 Tax=Paraburkholderia tropica TaxID=92647 RepID=A0AAQ1GBH3_9BURK|nr:enoyl-CoA hydratase/isomerase family protein [Paraburkholderia tropica]RQN34653.1 enoyl-CoA hydratase/isomerase family protein [Paraburkholderia tropica]SEI93697.1 Enoyl-CoA hydratase/carnithine racemase [Paraburkholderia tropica]
MNARPEAVRHAAVGTSAQTEALSPEQSDVLIRVVNRVAIVTLNRPAALNALSHAMVRELAVLLERVRRDPEVVALVLEGAGPKGFCAGGDVRAIDRLARAGERLGEQGWQQFFVDEYRLDYALHTFDKPVVALLDGVTMGGGMGLGQAASLRVATTRTKIAMPETRIGLLPDVGATHFLARMPAHMELYVGLTGALLNGADALHLHLADVCVPGDWLDGYEARLAQVSFDGGVYDGLRQVFETSGHDAIASPLAAREPLIARHFEPHARVSEMVASLRADLEGAPPGDACAWREATLDALTHYSPTMLEVTREALLRGRHATLAESFRMELGIVVRAIEEGDFCEGVRAHLVDKDRTPHWSPATLADLREPRVQHFLASPWRAEDHPLADLGA